LIEDRVKGEGLRGKGQLRKMKDSGVEWIGEIPEEWEVQPLGNFFNERKEKVSDLDFEPLSVTKNGIVKQLDNAAKTKNHNNRKRVCKGDFVINSRSDRKQSCGISPLDGSVSVINIVLYGKVLNPGFTRYLLDNYGFAEEFYRWGTGIVDDLWSTRFDKMKRILLPHPPSEEQQAIADYLDSKVALIDNIIEKTKQSIEDYKKYRQSLITETVTKGLNPDVEMKDSGIEWIGEVPSHWERYRLRNLFRFSNGLTVTKSDLIEDGVSCINYGDIHSKYTFDLDLKTDELPKVDIKFITDRPNTLLNNGDFVFCDTSEDLDGSGNFVFIRDTNGKDILAGSHTTIAKPQKKFNAAYMGYLLKSFGVKRQFEREVVGVKVYSITQGILKNIEVVLPPLDEQMAIANYLDHKRIQIDAIIDRKEQLIEELKVYQKSLIYECVTGKRYVG